MRQQLRSAAAVLAGVPFAVCYGLAARMLFGAPGRSDLIAPLSLAFLFLVPVGVGALAVWLLPARLRSSWTYGAVMPLVSISLAVVVAGALALEALICIVMALPILLGMGLLGGLLICALARRRQARDQAGPMMLGVLLLGPLLFAPFETRLPRPEAPIRTETRVVIRADAATVWRNIIEVPPIRPEERRFSLLFDLFGVPRPLRATLERGGVGGLRRGVFEDRLAFEETITAWEERRRIVWQIAVDERAPVPAPWNEIGGRFFRVSGAGYRIEPLDERTVVLHLDSTSQLATRFNGYGGLWVRWGLGEFQREVLHVIKARAEAEAAGR
jgi:hypothetical protein